VVPLFGHVVLVVEENHSYSEVIGNSAMPYLNSLAAQYGLATQYYANTHPSIGNYFMLMTGQIVTNNDLFMGTIDVDNMVRELIAAGKTWKSYAESIPYHGFTGGDTYPYAKRHNPFSYFTDVVNSSTQVQNLVSLSQFQSDLANNQLPNFSYLVPNLLDDGHDGPLQVADAWLQHNVAPLISDSTFQADGLLIIVFDEANTNDSTNGGGHVAALIISPKAKQGFHSTALYQHQSTLRLILQGLGVTTFPGAASNAPQMGEFF
jgi:phospholipase C